MLEINDLTKRLGKTQVLDDLSLFLDEGKIIGLLGPNGAGKTTLIRLIMGLLQPTSGEIHLFRKYLPGEYEARNQIGYMPQQLAIYSGLTVLENILFYGRMYRVDESILQQRADEILHEVDLDRWRDRLVSELSGGMVRRVMLATAMVHKPRLLILDEPTAGVDPLLRIQFWDWFRRLVEEGTSIIVTTHNIAEAGRCDQAIFLRRGIILENSAPDQLIEKYGCKDLEEAFVAAIHQHRDVKEVIVEP
ncbi:MAG: ABC transporter ATP-binding protein [Gammaproteobacteria bacterium]|nr:ABC transporter ATP-binding protein [Gammaproteobacteria bacterium]